MRQTTTRSWFAFSQHESNSADSVNEPRASLAVDLSTESGHLHIDYIVKRRRATWFLPDVACEHFAGYQMPLMAQQILKQFELSRRQVEQPVAASRTARHKVQVEIGRFQAERFRCTTAPQQCANAREQFGQGKRLDQVIIGAEVQSQH